MVGKVRTGELATDAELRGNQRERARKRLEAKRRLRIAVLCYVAVSLFSVVVWVISGRGVFWPGWVMAGGALVLLSVEYLRRPMTKAEINEEQGLGAWLGGRPAGNLPSEDDDHDR